MDDFCTVNRSVGRSTLVCCEQAACTDMASWTTTFWQFCFLIMMFSAELIILPSLSCPTGPGQSPLQFPSGLDHPALERSFQCFLEEGLSKSSWRVYSASWRRYLSIVGVFSLEANPRDAEKVTLFVVQAFLITQLESGNRRKRTMTWCLNSQPTP